MELNMDVRPDQLIDVTLTAAAMLVAGLLGMLIHSWWKERRPIGTTRFEFPILEPTSVTAPAVPVEGRRTIQFVSLGSPVAPASTELSGIRASLVEARRRNRADIIRQARQMIEQGAVNRDITQKLRMTDGELALIRQDMNR
jgi:hypothetical protein